MLCVVGRTCVPMLKWWEAIIIPNQVGNSLGTVRRQHAIQIISKYLRLLKY